jgi:glycosyltransferase involved in cell wall biosynthesis
MTRILLVRGHMVNPGELRPWLELPDTFQVRILRTASNRYSAPPGFEYVPVRTLRDLLPRGVLGEVAVTAIGDRYLAHAKKAFAWADVVHGTDLSFWFSAQAAAAHRSHRFRLVQTVWETLPLLRTFRDRTSRRYRKLVLAETDLFLPATERAALALRLEGVPAERIMVCPPGIDIERFAAALPAPSRQPADPTEHVIVSPGRLVWDKGHQDVIRALALLRDGIVPAPEGVRPLRLVIAGSGPEHDRLRAYADELGLHTTVEIRSVPHEQMPALFAGASAMVLASQGSAFAPLHPFGVPHAFWEEQFGLVLAEAMAAGLAIITTTSGAIPEVVAGTSAQLVAPGDWVAIAKALASGPLTRPPGARVEYDPELMQRYSTQAAAVRLAAAYDRLLPRTDPA